MWSIDLCSATGNKLTLKRATADRLQIQKRIKLLCEVEDINGFTLKLSMFGNLASAKSWP